MWDYLGLQYLLSHSCWECLEGKTGRPEFRPPCRPSGFLNSLIFLNPVAKASCLIPNQPLLAGSTSNCPMKYSLRSLMTFSIRDLALVTVIVAAWCLGWWADRDWRKARLKKNWRGGLAWRS